MENTKNYVALEEIDNNTICVLDKGKVRKMRHREDINEHLVYVSNIEEQPFLHKPISEDSYCRCVDIYIKTRERI